MNGKYRAFFILSWSFFLLYVACEFLSQGKYSQFSSLAGSYIFIVSVAALLGNSNWIYSMGADGINIDGFYFGLYPKVRRQIKFVDIKKIELIDWNAPLTVILTLARLPEVCGNIRARGMYLIHLKSRIFISRRVLITPNNNPGFIESLETLKLTIEGKK